MRYFVDTEFVDTGRTIDLISIGIVADSGAELYLELEDIVHADLPQWHQENVVPHLNHDKVPGVLVSRDKAAELIKLFVGSKPEFIGWYCAYDWVALCQLYGRMLDVPAGWPFFMRDLRQCPAVLRGYKLHKNAEDNAHNALVDARWIRNSYTHLHNRDML